MRTQWSYPTSAAEPVELIDVSNSGDEPMGIIAEGHVDIAAFRARCVERQRTDHGLDEHDVDPCDDIQHLYYIAVPSVSHEGDASFVEVPADWWGAQAVTVATFEHTGNHWTVEKAIEREQREHDKAMAVQCDLGIARSHRDRAMFLVRSAAKEISRSSTWAAMAEILAQELGEDRVYAEPKAATSA